MKETYLERLGTLHKKNKNENQKREPGTDTAPNVATALAVMTFLRLINT